MKKNLSSLVLSFMLVSCSTGIKDLSVEYYNLANQYFEMEEYDVAVDSYNRALEGGGDNVLKILYNLAISYAESGHPVESVEILTGLLKKDDKNIKLMRARAYSKYLAGDKSGALADYQGILDIFDYDKKALYNRSVILLEELRKEEALNLLERLYEVDKRIDVVLKLGDLYKWYKYDDCYIKLLETTVVEGLAVEDLFVELINHFKEIENREKYLFYLDSLLALEEIDDRSDWLFQKGALLVLESETFDRGLDFLRQAKEGGYSGGEKLELLLTNDDIYGLDKVKDLFKDETMD